MATGKLRKSKKPTIEQTARRLTSIAERHLQKLSPEQRETRLAGFERAISRASHGKHAKRSGTDDTRATQVAAQARE